MIGLKIIPLGFSNTLVNLTHLDNTQVYSVVEKKEARLSLTGRKGVAGIQTHSHSGLVSHFVYDALQLRELTTHCTALTTHVLQH